MTVRNRVLRRMLRPSTSVKRNFKTPLPTSQHLFANARLVSCGGFGHVDTLYRIANVENPRNLLACSSSAHALGHARAPQEFLHPLQCGVQTK